MMRVSYADGTFLTSDEIAHKLLDFTAALGRTNNALSMTVPIVGEDGVFREIDLVLGPASQMSAVKEESKFAEPAINNDILRMEEATILARPSKPEQVSEASPFMVNVPELDEE
jgi:hypothetical protein